MKKVNQEWDGKLRGGPFLEVSFLLTTGEESRVEFLEHFLATLRLITIPFSFVHTEQNSVVMTQFQEGYPYDGGDPNSIIIHKAEFSLIISFPEERKSRLYVEEIASHTLQFDFAFYGSGFDAPEWNQGGISPGDESKFLNFFEELYRVYSFPLGAIGYEVDCLFLFPEHENWPSEIFQIARFDPSKMPDNPEVEVVRWKGKYLKNKLVFYQE
jgi:hypothetical protein